VCGSAKPPVRAWSLEGRSVLLCAAHSERARQAGASSLRALRELFIEADGRRALVARRAPLERRLFPPRPEGRRRSQGRRACDAPS